MVDVCRRRVFCLRDGCNVIEDRCVHGMLHTARLACDASVVAFGMKSVGGFGWLCRNERYIVRCFV